MKTETLTITECHTFKDADGNTIVLYDGKVFINPPKNMIFPVSITVGKGRG